MLSSRIALWLPTDLQKHAEGLPHVVEDFGTLARLTAETDAIWESSVYAVADEIRSDSLCELPREKDAPQRELRMMMYSLEQRTRPILTKCLIQTLRGEFRALSAPSGPTEPHE